MVHHEVVRSSVDAVYDCLVVGKVNNNLVRLYSEAEPALGKILRNIKHALTPESGLGQVARFNEACLVPAGIDLLAHNPPYTFEALQAAGAGEETGRRTRIRTNVIRTETRE